MYRLLRIAVVLAPLGGGAAWAQGSGTSGSAGAPGGTLTPPLSGDTRTPMQQKAQQLDEEMPAPPAPKKIHRRQPVDERAIPRRTDVEHDGKIDAGDLGNKDQLNSDK